MEGMNVGVASNLKRLTRNISSARSYVTLPTPTSKAHVIRTIDAKQCNLVPSYTTDFWQPAKRFLEQADERFFTPLVDESLWSEKTKRTGRRARDIAQAVLQHAQNFEWEKTLPLQQLACDMWNTFVRSSGFCTTVHCLPPIVQWTDGDGAYARPKHDVSQLTRDSVPIVCFPKCFLNGGILAWTVMMHEIAHTILDSGLKLTPQLSDAVMRALEEEGFDEDTVDYWIGNAFGVRCKIQEVAADVMSVLYMGPMAAVGLLADFRACRRGTLLTKDIKGDTHPSDILRILILAYCVRSLKIEDAEAWFEFLMDEIRKDLDEDELDLSWKDTRRAARIIANVLMESPVVYGRSLKEIRAWNESDERLVQCYLENKAKPLTSIACNTAHIVAAANMSLLKGVQLKSSRDERIADTFQWMIKEMNLVAKKPCVSCDLTQKEVHLICPEPKVSVQREVEQENTGLSTGEKVAFGIGALALIGGGLYYLFGQSSGSNRKRGDART